MRTEPLVYGTYQSYLRRGVSHLQASIADAKKHGYMLGVKLVRGAYQPLEVSVHTNGAKSPEDHRAADPPVWCEKADTDDTYNSVDIYFFWAQLPCADDRFQSPSISYYPV